jgi:hypothetical protein
MNDKEALPAHARGEKLHQPAMERFMIGVLLPASFSNSREVLSRNSFSV